MSVNFNPNLLAQMGQSNLSTQQVRFTGGFAGGEQLGGGKKIGGDNFFAKEMAEVSDIGAQKKAAYENGVGGTNYATETTGNRLMFVA